MEEAEASWVPQMVKPRSPKGLLSLSNHAQRPSPSPAPCRRKRAVQDQEESSTGHVRLSRRSLDWLADDGASPTVSEARRQEEPGLNDVLEIARGDWLGFMSSTEASPAVSSSEVEAPLPAARLAEPVMKLYDLTNTSFESLETTTPVSLWQLISAKPRLKSPSRY